MIAVNGIKTDLGNQENDFVRHVYEPSMKLLKSLNLPRFTFGEPEAKKSITKEGVVEHSGGTMPQFTVNCSFKTDKGGTYDCTLTYYETYTTDKKNGNEILIGPGGSNRWNFMGVPIEVNMKTHSSLVWWLIFACPEIELIPELKTYQNQNRSRKEQYRLLNSAVDATNIVKARRAVAKAESLILNEETEGGLSEKDLRTMCRAMGIGNVNDMTIDQCRNLLHGKVIVKDGKWDRHNMSLVWEFLAGVKEQNIGTNAEPEYRPIANADAELKATIQALTEGTDPILKHVQGKWMMGEEVILKHKFSIDAKEALTIFFKEQPKILKDFQDKINNPVAST